MRILKEENSSQWEVLKSKVLTTKFSFERFLNAVSIPSKQHHHLQASVPSLSLQAPLHHLQNSPSINLPLIISLFLNVDFILIFIFNFHLYFLIFTIIFFICILICFSCCSSTSWTCASSIDGFSSRTSCTSSRSTP